MVGPLREHFVCAWFNAIGAAPARAVIVPDGFVDLVHVEGKLRVAGPDRERNVEVLPARATVVGLRFRAGAASRWLGIPLDRLLGLRVDLEDLWGRDARRLNRRLADEASPDDVARALEEQLLVRSTRVEVGERAIARVFDRVLERSIDELAREVGMSARTLRRRCHEELGYGPKTLARVRRFQRFLARARANDALAALALDAGYADQAHLTRETRALSGFTPRAIAAQLARWCPEAEVRDNRSERAASQRPRDTGLFSRGYGPAPGRCAAAW